ncbi:MAG: lactate utilization protein [Olsenella sp.]|jgi:hypothetical protein|nr:lactate utilization protein [Olsenella sp.]
MDANVSKRNELLAQTVIKGLDRRNITAEYAASREDALAQALAYIGEGSSVTMGGCATASQIGLNDALTSGNYNFIDRDKAEDRRAAMLAAYDVDVYVASANAITNDGVIVNIDGNSNRTSAIAYGPRHVLFLIGMNKVCGDLDAAIKRARNVAAPINAQRFDINTPCRRTGACADCKSEDTICCNFLITRFSHHPGRMHAILINDSLGF